MTNAVECLNGLLRGEISAVETYGQALQKLDEPNLAPTLREAQTCHQKRVLLLQNKIASMGGQPSEGAGAWGAFANFMQGSAAAMGSTPSVDMLEEGEDHGLKAYRDECDKCDSVAVRRFIEDELVPAQERTHSQVRNLKKLLHS